VYKLQHIVIIEVTHANTAFLRGLIIADLKRDKQCIASVKEAIGMIKRRPTFVDRTKETIIANLYKSLVRPHLEYRILLCAIILYGVHIWLKTLGSLRCSAEGYEIATIKVSEI